MTGGKAGTALGSSTDHEFFMSYATHTHTTHAHVPLSFYLSRSLCTHPSVSSLPPALPVLP